MSRFDDCYKIIRKLEGGYVNDPDDNGGATQSYTSIYFKFFENIQTA